MFSLSSALLFAVNDDRQKYLRFYAYSATITYMNFRIRIFSFVHQTVHHNYFISGAPVPGRKKETRVISKVSNEYAGIDELAEVP